MAKKDIGLVVIKGTKNTRRMLQYLAGVHDVSMADELEALVGDQYKLYRGWEGAMKKEIRRG